MYPISNTYAQKLFLENDKNTTAKLTISINGVTTNLSRFVASFGTVSRSMEYDTGKFSPARHSLTLTNTKDFGEYLFTLRNMIGSDTLPGTDYWTDLEYKLYYGFMMPEYFGSLGEAEYIQLFEGIINSKTENRVKQLVRTNANDLIKKFTDIKVAKKDTIVDTYFRPTTGNSNSDITPVQQQIRYGKFLLNDGIASSSDLAGTVSWGGVSPNNFAITTSVEHGAKVGDYVKLYVPTSASHNGTYVIYKVDSTTVVRCWAPTYVAGVGLACTATFYQFQEERKNIEKPGNCVVGIPNTYYANREGEDVRKSALLPQTEKYSILYSYPHVSIVNSRWYFTNTPFQNYAWLQYLYGIGATSAYYSFSWFTKNCTDSRYNKHEDNFPWAATFSAVNTIAIASSTNASPIRINTSTPHGFSNGDTVTVAGHLVNTNANGTWVITYINATSFTLNGSTGNGVGVATGSTYWTNKISITFTGSNLPAGVIGQNVNVAIWGGANKYKGDWTMLVTAVNQGIITTPYNGAPDANSYINGTNIMTMSQYDYGTFTGEAYFDTSDIGHLWYFPIQNYNSATCNIGQVWFYDYIAGMWCNFDPLNLTNVNYGYEILQPLDSSIPGFYIRFRTPSNIINIQTNGEKKWDSSGLNGWWAYNNGVGGYFRSNDPTPKIMVEFDGYTKTSSTSTYANPVAVLFDLLTSSKCGNIASTYFDYFAFNALDTSYTWDAAAYYFLDTGSWMLGGQINVAYNEEITLQSAIEEIMVVSGLMLTCSHIRTNDRRIRLIINKSYDNATEHPNPMMSYATNETVTDLEIVSANDKLKNKITIKNYIEHTFYTSGYFALITKQSGAADKLMEISSDSEPAVYWYSSNFWADRCAQNFLNKLKYAWEDVKITLDTRALIVDLADYVKVSDHFVNEDIVIQVYNYSFNLDTGMTTITGKKVWSNKG